jgi:hypothetical protein
MLPNNDPLDMDRIDQEIRINELKCEADEITGGKMASWESEDCPPEIAEQFWQNVVNFEKAFQEDDSKHIDHLRARGVRVPDPKDLSDADLSAKLNEIIHMLADLDTYLYHTDHMSDRELYVHLWSDTLNEFTYPGMTCILDLVGSGSDEDNQIYLRYYADDEYRDRHHKHWPNDVIPPREKPKYDRDRHLPKETLREFGA